MGLFTRSNKNNNNGAMGQDYADADYRDDRGGMMNNRSGGGMMNDRSGGGGMVDNGGNRSGPLGSGRRGRNGSGADPLANEDGRHHHRATGDENPPESRFGMSRGDKRKSNSSAGPGRGGSEGLQRAHDKLTAAQLAEREADGALARARAAVKEARAEVDIMEKDAKQEAKLAKAKLSEVKNMRRGMKGLGKR